MKRFNYESLVVMVLACSLVAFPAYGGMEASATQDSLSLAASYEQKAADLDKEIEMHEEMKARSDKPFGGKFGRRGRMDSHCDAIIAKAETLRDEYLDMAKGLRAQAV